MKKISVGIILIIILFGFYFYKNLSQKDVVIEKNKDTIINSVIFNCAENKSIQAIFFKDKVELNLSDKRNMLLLQAISASGARYANSDESFVFWNKGDTAFVEENKNITFKDCVIK